MIHAKTRGGLEILLTVREFEDARRRYLKEVAADEEKKDVSKT